MRSLLVAALLLASVLPASSAVIEANTWYHIIIGNSVDATNGANSDPAGIYFDPLAGPWTFNLTSAGTLEVTDADFNGDYISVLDGGIAFTPNPQGPIFNPAANCGLDPTACLADTDFWHLTVALTAKTYSLNFIGIDTPFQTTNAFFRVLGTIDNGTPPPPDPSVPEPATYVLTGASIAVLVSLRANKR